MSSKFDKLNEKGEAVLVALMENGGEASTAEIREFTVENEYLPELKNPDINYLVKTRLNDGNGNVSGLEFVTVRSPDAQDDTNESRAKIVEVRPSVRAEVDEFVSQLKDGLQSTSIDGYSTLESAFVDLTEQVTSNKQGVEEVDERLEMIINQFAEAMEARKEEIARLEQEVEQLKNGR